MPGAESGLLGAGQAAWILLELVYLPEPSWLQGLYGPLGLSLVLLATLPTVRNYLTTKHDNY